MAEIAKADFEKDSLPLIIYHGMPYEIYSQRYTRNSDCSQQRAQLYYQILSMCVCVCTCVCVCVYIYVCDVKPLGVSLFSLSFSPSLSSFFFNLNNNHLLICFTKYITNCRRLVQLSLLSLNATIVVL